MILNKRNYLKTYKMKEQDLREKFERFVNGYVGSSMLTNTEYPETIDSNAEKCVQITIDYAREEAIGFGLFLNEGRFTQYGNVWLNPKQGTDDNGDWLFFKTSELYEIYLTTKTQNK